jgi:hypothetical protein
MAGSLGYQTPVDIVNRALQHCRMKKVASITPPDHSANAQETAFVYDKLREAELRCNLWRFASKRAILRPISTLTTILATSGDTPSGSVLTFTSTAGATTGPVFSSNGAIASNTTVTSVGATTVQLSQNITGDIPGGTAISFGPQTLVWTPPTYAAGTSYALGAVVVDANGEWWQASVASDLGNTPTSGAFWSHYTGVDYMQPWNTQIIYFTGELVLASDNNIYMSLTSNNGNGTIGNDPTLTSGFWLLVNGIGTGLHFFYPIGAGPPEDASTRNVFRLPHGFLRQAPSDPKGNAGGWYGAPHGNWREDWVFEEGIIVSSTQGPLMLRYIENTVDVPKMDPMFCEMLAARIAEEAGPLLVQDRDMWTQILSNVRAHYKTERYKATTVNGIEIGPLDLDVDDYITCRL